MTSSSLSLVRYYVYPISSWQQGGNFLPVAEVDCLPQGLFMRYSPGVVQPLLTRCNPEVLPVELRAFRANPPVYLTCGEILRG